MLLRPSFNLHGAHKGVTCPWEGNRLLPAQVRAMLLLWEDRLAGENQAQSKKLSRPEGRRAGLV